MEVSSIDRNGSRAAELIPRCCAVKAADAGVPPQRQRGVESSSAVPTEPVHLRNKSRTRPASAVAIRSAMVLLLLVLSNTFTVGYGIEYFTPGVADASRLPTPDLPDVLAADEQYLHKSRQSYLYEHVELEPPHETPRYFQQHDPTVVIGAAAGTGSDDMVPHRQEESREEVQTGNQYYDYSYDEHPLGNKDGSSAASYRDDVSKTAHGAGAGTPQRQTKAADATSAEVASGLGIGVAAGAAGQHYEGLAQELERCRATIDAMEQRLVQSKHDITNAVTKVSLERDSCEAASTQLYANYERCRSDLSAASNCTDAAHGASRDLQECTLNLAKLETQLNSSLEALQKTESIANAAREDTQRAEARLNNVREEARRTEERLASQARAEAVRAEQRLESAVSEAHKAALERDSALTQLATTTKIDGTAFTARDALSTWRKLVRLARAIGWLAYDRLGIQRLKETGVNYVDVSRMAFVQLMKRGTASALTRVPRLAGAAQVFGRAWSTTTAVLIAKIAPFLVASWQVIVQRCGAAASRLNGAFDDIVMRLGTQYPELLEVIPTSTADRVAMLMYVWAALFIVAHLMRVLMHFILVPSIALVSRPCRRRRRLTGSESVFKQVTGGGTTRLRGKTVSSSILGGYADHPEGGGVNGTVSVPKKPAGHESEFRPAAAAGGPTGYTPSNNPRGSRKGGGSSKRQ